MYNISLWRTPHWTSMSNETRFYNSHYRNSSTMLYFCRFLYFVKLNVTLFWSVISFARPAGRCTMSRAPYLLLSPAAAAPMSGISWLRCQRL